MQLKATRSSMFILFGYALTACMLIFASACSMGSSGGSSSQSGGKNPSSIHVGFVTETSRLDFALEMAAGAQYAAEQYHVSAQIVAPDAFDPAEVLSMFKNLTKTAHDGIGIATLEPPLLEQSEASAVKAGIPVIAVDAAPTAKSGITTYIGNDNISSGALLADEAIAHIPTTAQGNIIFGIDTPGLGVLVDRVQGMKQEFKRLRPNLNIIGPFDSKQSVQDNLTAWNTMIDAHSNIVASLGVGDADNSSLAEIKQNGHSTFLTGAFDLDPTALQAIVNGTNFALVDPEHFLKGYVAMRLLIEHALYGNSIPQGWWNTGSLLVNQTNVQNIVQRQTSLDAKGAFYVPIADQQFADPAAQIKPMSQVR